MLDTHLQERFTRRCTDAAFGYTAATTAAYVAFADQVFDFWAGVLAPTGAPAKRDASASQAAWSWPVPMPAPRQEAAPAPLWPFAWAVPQPRSAAPGYPFAGAGYDPFRAWFAMFPFAAPFAAPSAAWPMAFMLIASGVPRAVAWPTAEANVAAMEAADAAAVSVQQVFSSYRTDGGHSVARQAWPPASLAMLAMFMPLSFSTMLSSMRLA